MRNIFFIIIIVLISTAVIAQQEAQFSQYMYQNMSFNPGFAGSNNSICVNALSRQQWLGFTDAESNKVHPQTSLITIDGPSKLLHGGLGATIIKDKIGFENTITLKLGYAYRFNIGQGELGIGAQAGFINRAIDFSKFRPVQSNDPIVASTAEEKTMATDVNFGVYYNFGTEYYVGASMSQILQTETTIGSANSQLKRHYYLTGGYNYILPANPSFDITPSFLAKSDIASTQIDINLTAKYNNKFWGGVSYRTTDAAVAMVGVRFKQYLIGYSYDFTLSQMRKAGSNGSHELMLSYCFNIIYERQPQSYRNVRFL